MQTNKQTNAQTKNKQILKLYIKALERFAADAMHTAATRVQQRLEMLH